MPSILFVCTANLCRSPMAEHAFRSRAQELGLDWNVRSAGTDALDGEPMHPLAVEVLNERQVDVGSWASQSLTDELVNSSDLVLTAARSHLSRILRIWPAAVQRAFVLGQFAQFLSAVEPRQPATDPADLIAIARRGRARAGAGAREAHDLKDPIRGRVNAFRTCAETIDESVAAITGRLTG
jgi:protein-tyrosine phosphatase